MVVVAYSDWRAERAGLVEVGDGVSFVPSELDAGFAVVEGGLCDVAAAAGPDGAANSPTVAKMVETHTKESANERSFPKHPRRPPPRELAIDLMSIVSTRPSERSR
jgi:hypothetical protein